MQTVPCEPAHTESICNFWLNPPMGIRNLVKVPQAPAKHEDPAIKLQRILFVIIKISESLMHL